MAIVLSPSSLKRMGIDMMPPRDKRIASVTPEAWGRGIRYFIEKEDGRLFDERRPCPECGSNKSHKLGFRERLYAKLLKDGGGFRDVKVRLQRFRCKECRHVYTSQGPFYDECLYGKDVVDMAVYLSAGNPFNRVETVLMSAGLQIDRDTVKNWIKLFIRRCLQAAPVTIFGVNVAVNTLRLFFGEEAVEEVRREMKHATFMGDETFEPILGAKKRLEEDNRRREDEGRFARTYPDSWMIASSYLAEARIFATVLVTDGAINSLLARVVLNQAEKGDLVVTDGNPSYNVVEHVNCVNHKGRNELGRDRKWRMMKRDNVPREEREEYARMFYSLIKKKTIEALRASHPQLFDENGNFDSWVTTNPLEGANRRFHYELRTSYKDREALFGREVLIVAMDSLCTFRHGRPEVSFGAAHSSFTIGDVMDYRPQALIPIAERDNVETEPLPAASDFGEGAMA